ncbi:hypothetical protein PAXINDRAFT_5924 [Paxillus involutus ATCC 200175]|nr:hypothetical protein PAXINDRAFT_5924 [Paxillus involutus ATCC 200175]
MASIQKINTSERPQRPIYSHAVKVPGLIFLSGQVPKQCLNNLGDVLNAAGSSWDKVVKVNIYLKNMDDFESMNEAYVQTPPTWVAVMELDILRDEGLAYAEKLRNVGVSVTHKVYKKAPHQILAMDGMRPWVVEQSTPLITLTILGRFASHWVSNDSSQCLI